MSIEADFQSPYRNLVDYGGTVVKSQEHFVGNARITGGWASMRIKAPSAVSGISVVYPKIPTLTRFYDNSQIFLDSTGNHLIYTENMGIMPVSELVLQARTLGGSDVRLILYQGRLALKTSTVFNLELGGPALATWTGTLHNLTAVTLNPGEVLFLDTLQKTHLIESQVNNVRQFNSRGLVCLDGNASAVYHSGGVFSTSSPLVRWGRDDTRTVYQEIPSWIDFTTNVNGVSNFHPFTSTETSNSVLPLPTRCQGLRQRVHMSNNQGVLLPNDASQWHNVIPHVRIVDDEGKILHSFIGDSYTLENPATVDGWLDIVFTTVEGFCIYDSQQAHVTVVMER